MPFRLAEGAFRGRQKYTERIIWKHNKKSASKIDILKRQQILVCVFFYFLFFIFLFFFFFFQPLVVELSRVQKWGRERGWVPVLNPERQIVLKTAVLYFCYFTKPLCKWRNCDVILLALMNQEWVPQKKAKTKEKRILDTLWITMMSTE